MNAQPHIIKITMRRQESPLQILDGPQSLHAKMADEAVQVRN